MKNNQNFWKFGRPGQTNSSSKTRFWCIWQIINNVELICSRGVYESIFWTRLRYKRCFQHKKTFYALSQSQCCLDVFSKDGCGSGGRAGLLPISGSNPDLHVSVTLGQDMQPQVVQVHKCVYEYRVLVNEAYTKKCFEFPVCDMKTNLFSKLTN